jgi:hypothetical protein
MDGWYKILVREPFSVELGALSIYKQNWNEAYHKSFLVFLARVKRKDHSCMSV